MRTQPYRLQCPATTRTTARARERRPPCPHRQSGLARTPRL